MNVTNSYTRPDAALPSALKRYQELVWRLTFLRTRGAEDDQEPTHEQICDWYRRIPRPPQSSLVRGLGNDAKSISQHFEQLFPDQTAQFGPACLEFGQADELGQIHPQPLLINHDTLAASLSDPRIGLDVVYYDQEMQFFYKEPFQNLYKPVSPEKVQGLYRGLVLRTASSVKNVNGKLNVWAEFRSDKNCRLIIQRAKAILSASPEFFSPTSKHQRIRGIELMERVARRFVSEMLTCEPGQILKLADAYAVFRGLLKQRDLPDIKRSDFKAVVGPLIRDQFSVALRNDLDGAGVRGWKNVRLVQTGPG